MSLLVNDMSFDLVLHFSVQNINRKVETLKRYKYYHQVASTVVQIVLVAVQQGVTIVYGHRSAMLCTNLLKPINKITWACSTVMALSPRRN